MWSLVSEIESYIKSLLRENPRGWIELSRKELAEHFDCVPSQVTYVVNTRFSVHQGYYVESRRGGSGYIRICRLGAQRCQPEKDVPQKQPENRTGDDREIMVKDFPSVMFSLTQRGILTDREFTLLNAVFRALEANVQGGECGDLRLRILKEILSSGGLF
ncbi:MAG: CtsR family transcriptional regulator [Thermacetogeniaceae bacterium]